MRQEVSNEEFERQVGELEEKLENTGFNIKYSVERLLNNEAFDSINKWSDVERVLPNTLELDEKYNLRYYKNIKPEYANGE